MVDYLIDLHQKTGTNKEFEKDYAFGYRFYISNKYVVEEMRASRKKETKPKHAPQMLMINMARYFNIDFNYFYNPNIEAKDGFLSNETNLASSQTSDKTAADLNNEVKHYKDENSQLRKDILQLNKELTDCHKVAFEAQKGQTEALKELLSLKSNS
ncbi:hypothetical protein [uncultured Aquimarina sp.]|nr:hypothetical protein [uncultured Aquimarina sp.]